MINRLKKKNINTGSHYAPLHSSPAGIKYGREHGSLVVSDNLANRLLRLTLWVGLQEVNKITDALFDEPKSRKYSHEYCI